jgi:hypothetical protein
MYNYAISFYLVTAYEYEINNFLQIEIDKLANIVLNEEQTKLLNELQMFKAFCQKRMSELKV